MIDNEDFIPEFVYDETRRLFADDSEMFGEEDKEEENQIDNIDDSEIFVEEDEDKEEENQIDDIDDSEIFVEDEDYDEDDIEPYFNTDTFFYSGAEDFEPQYYDEYVLFGELTRYNKIKRSDRNMETLKRTINFIVERFGEHGVYADVIINDKNKCYSMKHNRKTLTDIMRIKELIDKGFNNSQIERSTGITRKTIAKYRNMFK